MTETAEKRCGTCALAGDVPGKPKIVLCYTHSIGVGFGFFSKDGPPWPDCRFWKPGSSTPTESPAEKPSAEPPVEKRDALAVVLMASRDRLGELATKMALIERERDDLHRLLRDILGRLGREQFRDWLNALQVIRDRIDTLPSWSEPTGETYEEAWLRKGYRVVWSESQPRAYEVYPRDEHGTVWLVRLRTVQAVDRWIREAVATGEEGRVGHGDRLPDSSRRGDRGDSNDHSVSPRR